MAGKKFGGDKIKREKMKTRNPRGEKRGGKKYDKKKRSEETTEQFMARIHKKYQ
jgi:hypothetical protein